MEVALAVILAVSKIRWRRRKDAAGCRCTDFLASRCGALDRGRAPGDCACRCH